MASDTLRTRIAAVIRREVPCHPPAADRIAREVIRELDTDYILVPKSGLTPLREFMSELGIADDEGGDDWTADD